MKQFLLLISLTLILSSFKTIPEKIFDSKAYKELGSPDTLVVPEGYTAIGDGAFYWCRSLTSISIPNSVTSIMRQAFANCSSLPSISIPNSVTFIGEYAFEGCYVLNQTDIPSRLYSFDQDLTDGDMDDY